MKSDSVVRRFFAFLGDVKQEVGKISWPTKNEVVVMTIIVFVIAIVAALFFSVVDSLSYTLVHFIIGG